VPAFEKSRWKSYASAKRLANVAAYLSCLVLYTPQAGRTLRAGGRTGPPPPPQYMLRRALASPRVGARITRVRFSTKSNYLSHLTLAAYLLTYFLTHPNRGDSLWQAFAGRSPGGGLQCLRRSRPHPTRAPGLSTALLSLTDALGNAITHREPFLQRRRHRHHCHCPGGHVRLCLLLNQRFCDCDCRSCMGWCHRACWEKRLFFSHAGVEDGRACPGPCPGPGWLLAAKWGCRCKQAQARQRIGGLVLRNMSRCIALH
jgi:hypothetical protein